MVAPWTTVVRLGRVGKGDRLNESRVIVIGKDGLYER